jgi:preprotein translocase subunit SecD
MKKLSLLFITALLFIITAVPVSANGGVLGITSRYSVNSGDIVTSLNLFFDSLKEGLTSIRGGVKVTLSAKTASNGAPSTSQLLSAKSILENRLSSQGFDDVKIYFGTDNCSVFIEAYSKRFNKLEDAKSIVSHAIKPLYLTFQEVSEEQRDADGNYLPTGKIIITGDNITDVNVIPGVDILRHQLGLVLDKKGAVLFTKASKRLIGYPIGIFLDDELISAPTVQEEITGGKVNISGLDNQGISADEIAGFIRSGPIPLNLTITSYEEVE